MQTGRPGSAGAYRLRAVRRSPRSCRRQCRDLRGNAPARGDFPKMDLVAVIAKILPYFERFDGLAVEPTDEFARHAARRWRQGNVLPVEAQTIDGRWKLLTSHPRPDGGIALVSIDITEMKRAQIAHLENAEIFRCITDSHPLPVWVVDEESKQILYESLDASNLLGRKWRPHERQYITAHFVDPDEFEEIRSLAGKHEIVRDHEIQLRRTDGSIVWCSTNCRRGFYRGRPSLVIGVLDITERKQREDLFGFLIKNHPLPVWMNDASYGRGHLPERCRRTAVRAGRGRRSQAAAARGSFRRPRAISGNRPGTDARRRRRKLRGPSQGRRRPGILGQRQFERRRVPGPTGGPCRHCRRDEAEEARRRGRAGARDACQCRRVPVGGLRALRRRSSAGDVQPALPRAERAGGGTHQARHEMDGHASGIGAARHVCRRDRPRGGVAQRSHPEPDEIPEPLRGRPRQRQMAFGVDASHRSRRLRRHASRHQRAQEGRGCRTRSHGAAAKGARRLPVPTRMSTIDGQTLYRNPASRELYGDRAEAHGLLCRPGRPRYADRRPAGTRPYRRFPGAAVRRRRTASSGVPFPRA